jgi:hypothetical protein
VRGHADDRAAACRDEPRQHALRHQVGRPQVEREHRLEVGQRRVGHGLAGLEAADEVGERAQRLVGVVRREPDDARHVVGIGEIGLGRLRRVVQPLERAGQDVWHDDAPAGVHERLHDRHAEPAGAAGDQCGSHAANVAIRRPL